MKDTKTGLLIHTYKYAGSVPYTKALEMKSRKDKEYWGENPASRRMKILNSSFHGVQQTVIRCHI